MSTSNNKYAWEDWQLTAYLLDEVEPEVAQQISEAAKKDPQLAAQLDGLSSTLKDLKAVLAVDGTSPADQAALAALGQQCKAEHSSGATETGAGGHVRPASAGYTWRRLVTRWENWASLAGLILIGVMLYQRPIGERFAINTIKDNVSSPENVPQSKTGGVDGANGVGAMPKSQSEGLDSTVIHEAWNQTTNSAVENPHPFDESKVDRVQSMLGQQGQGGADMVVQVPATNVPTETWTVAPGVTENEAVAAPNGSENSGQTATLAAGAGGGRTYTYPGSAGMPSVVTAPADMPSPAGGYPPPGTSQPTMPQPSMPQPGQQVQLRADAAGLGSDVYFNELEKGKRNFRIDGEGFQRLDEKALKNFEAPVGGGDRFASFNDNPFLNVKDDPLSTFSIDVDTAAYAKARQYLLEHRQLPPPASVRIEEFINYFDYDYAGPKDDKPFAAALSVTSCPWQPKHQLVRVALQAKQVENAARPRANLVFLLDVSGSMNEPNKLPLVKETMRLLTYQLTENDKVAMVVYAGAAGCVLESTHGHQQDKILEAIERLNAGGSTNGAQGIELAYKLARDNFIQGGINRVILCTDGDFNVGVTSTDALVDLVKQQAQSNVFLTVLGYGIGNTNDAMMEQIADRGNGLYGFVDSRREAQRQMVKQLAGNLMTVAKDVKIQVEFNPTKIASYRLIGYENRRLAAEDFNNDKKDAGEIGAGHRVTAIYELVPVGSVGADSQLVDALRYQPKKSEPVAPVKREEVKLEDSAVSQELLAVKVRYKQPEGSESQLLTFPLEDKVTSYNEIDKDFRWAAAMAEFGMLLRNSPHKGSATWSTLAERARAALGTPIDTVRAETLEMINTASQLSH